MFPGLASRVSAPPSSRGVYDDDSFQLTDARNSRPSGLTPVNGLNVPNHKRLSGSEHDGTSAPKGAKVAGHERRDIMGRVVGTSDPSVSRPISKQKRSDVSDVEDENEESHDED